MSQQRTGAVKQITSHANPIVKEIKGLVAQRKHRSQSGLFVAEGLKLATDALEAGWGVRYLALGPEARDNPGCPEGGRHGKGARRSDPGSLDRGHVGNDPQGQSANGCRRL